MHIPSAVNVALNPASQTIAGLNGQSSSRDDFRALMTQADLEVAVPIAPTGSARSATSTVSHLKTSAKQQGQPKDASKKRDLSTENPVVAVSQPVPVVRSMPVVLSGHFAEQTPIEQSAPTGTAEGFRAPVNTQATIAEPVPIERSAPNGTAEISSAPANTQATGVSETRLAKPSVVQPTSRSPILADEDGAPANIGGLSASELTKLYETVVAGPSNADIASAMSVIETDTSHLNLIPAREGGPSSNTSVASSQSEGKAGGGNRKSRAQLRSGREDDSTGSVQTSTHEFGQSKSITAMVKVENSPEQNPLTNPIADNGITNTTRNASKNHIPVTQNTAIAPETHEPAPEISVTSPLGSVQTARLVQHLSDTELHVGIAAGEFGKIDIHTSVSESQISARIYVEHDDLKAALVGSLPQFHEKMSAEHRLDAQIELYNTGSNFSNGSDRQQQQQRTPEQNRPASLDAEFLTPPAGTVQDTPSTATTMGLDMHA